MKKNQIRFAGGIVCLSSAVDQATQSLSIFNTLDQLTVEAKKNKSIENGLGKINVPISFQVISIWKRALLSEAASKIDTKLEIEFLDPLGVSLHKTTVNILIPENMARSRYILNVNGTSVTRTGEYAIIFREVKGESKSEILATMTFDVVIKNL